MKKFYGVVTFMIVFSICFGFTAVKASSVMACADGIKYGSFNIYTGYMNKTNLSSQSYTITFAKTSLTNPCTNCQIAGKVFKDDGDIATGASAKMGETQVFPGGTSASLGNWRFGLMRADFTLLTTSADFIWNYN